MFFKAYTHKDKDNGQREKAIKFWTVENRWKRNKLFPLTRESCLKLVVEKQRTNIIHNHLRHTHTQNLENRKHQVALEEGIEES